jgi:nicotinamidase-related amidase/type 1 glutamine amidotransferase
MKSRTCVFPWWWQRAVLLAFGLAVAPSAVAADQPENGGRLALRLRSRIEVENSGRYRAVEKSASWNPGQTAIIVCDMWDLHHCLNAVRRLKEMAPRMNQVLKTARAQGVLIIHAPSSCMDAYKDHPARQRALATPRSKNLPKDIGQGCNKIPSEEKGIYPIDQTDGGEDDDLAEHEQWAKHLASIGRDPRAPWKTETDLLTIDASDVISDSGEEIWSVLENRGIANVILLGVHTNMCVLGRPFGLRQMAKNGKNVVLMRDMTDTMYNPKRSPYVSHFSGTDLIIEHVEKFVCPSITSDQLLGGTPFRFKDDTRPHVVMLLAEEEYKTEITLPVFASEQLAKGYHVSYVFSAEKDPNDLAGIGVLNDADLAIVSMRRRVLPAAQVETLRKFVASGKAVLGIRTASHAFSPRDKGPIPEGHAAWTTFDADVLGGNYHGHYGDGPKVAVSLAPGAAGHPILRGVDPGRLVGNGSLYKVSPLAPTATVLLLGRAPGQPSEPVAWVNAPATKGRVFYTSLGDPEDFALPEFNRLLQNAIAWATGSAQPAAADAASTKALLPIRPAEGDRR